MKMKKYLIAGTLAVSMLMPLLSGAATVEEIQAQIKVLMAQVATLQAQLNAQQGGGTTPWCHTFSVNLGMRSRGLEVAELMTALSRSGNDTGAGSSDSNPPFSENTASAVTAFQEKYKDEILAPSGLKKGTGFVGPSTRKKLNQLYGCGGDVMLPPNFTPLSSSLIPISTSTTIKQWSSVTFGNGLFVAVTRTCNSSMRCNGEKANVMTSPDGINWTLRQAASNNSWSSVTYGNGLFVAVSIDGSGHQAMTSSDGVNWTIQNTPGEHSWNSITYGNQLFLAVSLRLDATIGAMTSSDGINWTTHQISNQFIHSVTFGNGLFVAVGYRTLPGKAVIYSTDGINWHDGSTPDIPYHFDYESVTFGNGIFVALPNVGSYVMTSSDGINWTIHSTPNVSPEYSNSTITFGNGLFVALSNNLIRISQDGINWTLTTVASNNYWTSVTYGNGRFVAVSRDGAGHQVMTSSDGLKWSIQPTP